MFFFTQNSQKLLDNIDPADQGFTLIEILVAIAIFTVLSLGMIVLFSNIFTSSAGQSRLLDSGDQARRASFQIMQELRNAVTSNTGAYALAQAGDQQLIFYSNIDGGSDIERVRYYVSGGNLHRGIVKPTGVPFAYNVAMETSRVVQANLVNGTSPVFYYYNDTYTGTGQPLAQPVNVTQAKFIRVELRIANSNGMANGAYFTVESSVALRSLKANLGN